jgi:acyl CoA:acetate/3-ketoacid CoA transferase beta subunit
LPGDIYSQIEAAMDAQTIIARRIARELRAGMLVNLGIRIPTLVANYLPDGVNVFFRHRSGAGTRHGTSDAEPTLAAGRYRHFPAPARSIARCRSA